MQRNTMKYSVVFYIKVWCMISLHECVHVTEFCPRNKTEWERRTTVFKCSKSKSYMCLPNEQLTDLVELCFNGPKTPINAGVCLFLEKKGVGLGIYNCSTFSNGCPNSVYHMDTVYAYPSCLSIVEGCFLAESTCKRNSFSPYFTTNVTATLNITTEPTNTKDKKKKDEVLIAVTLPLVFLIICMAVIIFLLWTKRSFEQFIFCIRPKEESKDIGVRINCHDEDVSLMKEIDKKNKTIDGTANIAQSDRLVDGPAPSHSRGQNSITYDSGVSNSSGFKPLHISCVRGYEEAVNALIKGGACINACDEDGKTSLYRSCENGHFKIVHLLLEKGADANMCDKDGYSPLYAACQEGHQDIVKLLLDNGADANMRGEFSNNTTKCNV